jgi:hypothetical protein
MIYEVNPSEKRVVSHFGPSYDAGFYDSDHINQEVYLYGDPMGLVRLLLNNGFQLIEEDTTPDKTAFL